MREQASAEPAGDDVGVEVAVLGEERGAVGPPLAVHGGRPGAAVEPLLDLRLEERALLLDDDDLVEAVGEAVDDPGLEGPGHADAQQAHAPAGELGVVEPEGVEGLAQVEPALAGRDDADPRRSVADDAVEAVGGGVAAGDLEPGAVEVALDRPEVRLQERRRGRVHVLAAVDRHVRGDDAHAVRVEVDGAGAVGHRGDHLERGPQPARAGERDGVAPEVEDVLRVGGVEHRDGHVGQRRLGGAGHARRLRRGVVADERDGAAARVGAGEVGVAQGVGGAVEAGRLAVPVADDPVAGERAGGRGELGALHRGEGELLVEPGREDDVVLGEQVAVAGELEVVAGERRALVARDVAPGAQARGTVGAVLVEGQAHEGLDAGEVHAAGGQGVAVAQGHGPLREAVTVTVGDVERGRADVDGHGAPPRRADVRAGGPRRPATLLAVSRKVGSYSPVV